MISTGGSFFSGWRMVRFLTTILPKSAERRKPPFEPTHVEKSQLQKKRKGLGCAGRPENQSKVQNRRTPNWTEAGGVKWLVISVSMR